ncbi:MAG TPA: UDP-N-acetylglucosamine 1-carboxyvinyltransferase [Candidatus Levybacteria bacterium]|nr:UDP-N-acetylglucosamine 1-carboxyvinyltransferase [Candidatus Levybacteria bacterium]
MKKYRITGGNTLEGEVTISGSKNVVTKALIASCLTSEEVVLENVPLISDFLIMVDLIKAIGGDVTLDGHTVKVQVKDIAKNKIPLEIGAKVKTSSMFLAPLLARSKEAHIPNPGGCRIGARPIDRHIEGLEKMGASIGYASEDGYFHAHTDGLIGAEYTFEKNTHTGTETLILAAVLAKGKTVLHNAAQEPEIDDLIVLLNKMGAQVNRVEPRTIEVVGVEKLHGTNHSIMPDRNEAVTFAVISALTGGNVVMKKANLSDMQAFLEAYTQAGGTYEEKEGAVRFYLPEKLTPVDVTTKPHPGFMTDWQGPWALLMTQADGESTIHETIYENRFMYVTELAKMGVKLEMFAPAVDNPQEFYNFNYDTQKNYQQGLKIYGKASLHNAVLNMYDLRAGATVVIASLIAHGESTIYGIEIVERGYERFHERLQELGAQIEVLEE